MVCEPNKQPEQALRNHSLVSSDIIYGERKEGETRSQLTGGLRMSSGGERLSSMHKVYPPLPKKLGMLKYTLVIPKLGVWHQGTPKVWGHLELYETLFFNKHKPKISFVGYS